MTAANGYPWLVRALIFYGADRSMTDVKGRTALRWTTAAAAVLNVSSSPVADPADGSADTTLPLQRTPRAQVYSSQQQLIRRMLMASAPTVAASTVLPQ